MSPTRKLHLAALVAGVFMFAVMARLAAFPILDTAWLVDPEEVYRLLGNLSGDQIRAYEIVLKIDFAFAIAYPTFLALTLQYYAEERIGSRRLLFVLLPIPLLAGLLDLLENASILAIVGALPETIGWANRLGMITSAKWVMVSAALLVVVGLALFAHGRARSCRKQ